jgi:hypothetical protein
MVNGIKVFSYLFKKILIIKLLNYSYYLQILYRKNTIKTQLFSKNVIKSLGHDYQKRTDNPILNGKYGHP